MRWHLSFNNPASKTVNNPVGPAPIIKISVVIIPLKIKIERKQM
jgi:hypothetical protein